MKKDNIGMCKQCGNTDNLSKDNLCSKCCKHEPELKCCGQGLEFISNQIQYGILNEEEMKRILIAECVVCGHRYTISYLEENI